jgi:hypothetical protein
MISMVQTARPMRQVDHDLAASVADGADAMEVRSMWRGCRRRR